MQDVMKITNNSPLVAALVYLSAWDMAGTPPMSKSEMGQHNSTPHCLFFEAGMGSVKKGYVLRRLNTYLLVTLV